jgi:hypothetical protein
MNIVKRKSPTCQACGHHQLMLLHIQHIEESFVKLNLVKYYVRIPIFIKGING